jgi:hypothetical protein
MVPHSTSLQDGQAGVRGPSVVRVTLGCDSVSPTAGTLTPNVNKQKTLHTNRGDQDKQSSPSPPRGGGVVRWVGEEAVFVLVLRVGVRMFCFIGFRDD